MRFERDCAAVLVPQGDAVTLPAGTVGYITQALGGSYTVFVEGNLFRIAGQDADAIGKEPAEALSLPDGAGDDDVEKLVWQQLRTCFDPEIPINVVDLGLIYRCEATPLPGGGNRVEIDMSMTAPGCGMGDILAEDARNKVLTVPGVAEVQVEVVFDPPWGMERMSEAAKLQLGLY